MDDFKESIHIILINIFLCHYPKGNGDVKSEIRNGTKKENN